MIQFSPLKAFLEVAKKGYPKWDLNPHALNFAQML